MAGFCRLPTAQARLSLADPELPFRLPRCNGRFQRATAARHRVKTGWLISGWADAYYFSALLIVFPVGTGRSIRWAPQSRCRRSSRRQAPPRSCSASCKWTARPRHGVVSAQVVPAYLALFIVLAASLPLSPLVFWRSAGR